MRNKLTVSVLAVTLAAFNAVQAQLDTKSATAVAVPVTDDNFRRAETHMFFGNVVKQGGFGKFHHHRGVRPRCGAGDGHAARCRQALQVDDRDQ